jgi:hypothetical protein
MPIARATCSSTRSGVKRSAEIFPRKGTCEKPDVGPMEMVGNNWDMAGFRVMDIRIA